MFSQPKLSRHSGAVGFQPMSLFRRYYWQGYEGIEPQSFYLFGPVSCAPYTIALY